jgi:hypothetical protein
MHLRDMSSKPAANATTAPVDLEHGCRDDITPSVSSSPTPDGSGSKAATPTPRRSLELQDVAPHHGEFHAPRMWTRLHAKLPAPLLRLNHQAGLWLKGPEPPKIQRITPLLERIQTLPVRLLARLPRWMRVCIYLTTLVVWAVLFGVIITNYSMPTNLAGFGAPVALSCVTSLW